MIPKVFGFRPGFGVCGRRGLGVSGVVKGLAGFWVVYRAPTNPKTKPKTKRLCILRLN